jgi:hypothetical protein
VRINLFFTEKLSTTWKRRLGRHNRLRNRPGTRERRRKAALLLVVKNWKARGPENERKGRKFPI